MQLPGLLGHSAFSCSHLLLFRVIASFCRLDKMRGGAYGVHRICGDDLADRNHNRLRVFVGRAEILSLAQNRALRKQSRGGLIFAKEVRQIPRCIRQTLELTWHSGQEFTLVSRAGERPRNLHSITRQAARISADAVSAWEGDRKP